MHTSTLVERSAPFLGYLDAWLSALPTTSLAALVAGHADQVALVSVDLINGFCNAGPLSGPRVHALIPPIVALFERAHALGVRAFVLTQDTHPPDTPEFASFPPHCLAGTPESQAVDELKALSFADQVLTFEKNSLSSHIGTGFGAWVRANPQLETFIIVGDCTDLCVYSAAMQLRLEANAHGLNRRVIVPANAVDTYDTPVSVAQELGIKAHDADLHHALFLHHMATNGVEVVRIEG